MIELIRKYKDSGRAKLAVFLGSLLFCLAALEVGLRATGWMIESGRERNFMGAFDESSEYDFVYERYRPSEKGTS